MPVVTTDVAGAGALAHPAPGGDDEARLAVRVIEPRSGWVPIGWRELWEYRELLGFLVWRDVKVRYKQTVLGAAWAILQPLMTMVMFTLLFGRLAKMPSDGLPYAPFAFAALIPWTFFSNAVASSATSLLGNTHLISKVYFPRLLIVLSTLGTGLLDLFVALGVMFAMLAWYGAGLTWHVLALPAFIVLTVAVAFGVGAALSALCAVYRDVRYVIPFLTQLWMFASPVIYPVRFIPDRWRWLFYLNPLTGVIDGFRSSLLGLPLNGVAIASSCGVTLVIGWTGLAYFRRVERRVADLI
jgi:lipopolysaccharide transport system permease protein